MAHYDITHTCGHDERIELFGKTSERERRIEWLQERPCTECWKKERAAEAEARRNKEAAMIVEKLGNDAADAVNALSNATCTLEGSAKQVAWAESFAPPTPVDTTICQRPGRQAFGLQGDGAHMETVSDMIAGFLAGLTPGTRARYRSVVSRWLRWCADNGIDMLRAKRTHIEVFAAYGDGMRPAAKNTVYKNLSVVCGLYRYMCEEGYIDCDPGEHVRRPKMYGHSDGSYLTREQARLFLAEARGMDARTDALCSLLLLTGARVSEALGLDVEDCHLDDGRPWVRFDRKGDWSQRVAIPSEASKALARLIGGRRHGAVFREDSGARLRQQTAVGIVSSVALRVGVPDISPHSLRRTFCTLSRDAGVPDRDIMAAGGWSSPQMLDYYDMSRRGLNGKAGDGLQRFLNNG